MPKRFDLSTKLEVYVKLEMKVLQYNYRCPICLIWQKADYRVAARDDHVADYQTVESQSS